uniref:F-box domain-containing protein n=1 Tax=Moniliophthora roreri TaxID=221103 RepID=A0A0W0FFS4_MONRR
MTSITPSANANSYVCDTLPAPRLAPESSKPLPVHHHPEEEEMSVPVVVEEFKDDSIPKPAISPVSFTQLTGRKLCVRHQRMADEGTNLKLQQSLDRLPVGERESVSTIWSIFSSSSHPRRALILQGLLTMCCFSQLSLLTEQLAHLIRIDPFSVFPREVSMKVLGYLDATSLCRASQVSKRWKNLADDDILWRGICEQHIGQKCPKCGWGLPILEKKRAYHNQNNHVQSMSPCPSPNLSSMKRSLEDVSDGLAPSLKRQKSESTSMASRRELVPDPSRASCAKSSKPPECDPTSSCSILTTKSPPRVESTRPWKDVYSERMKIERNWRRGRCTMRTLKGHTDGVMCLQFSETLSHPSFPILITGSYDCTARVWNLETGVELHCLKGHTQPIRALQFDDVKLITGSMDTTLKVWDWRRGHCVRTLTGHTEGVVCLNFDSNVLASGSVDSTIKVWNLRTGGAFTLRGHRDWVNAVQLWDSNSGSTSSTSSTSVFDIPGCGAPQIDPGKMLFSASDDGSIKLWDLTLRSCVRHFVGHVAQVQSMKLLLASECDDTPDPTRDSDTGSEIIDVDMPPSFTPDTSPPGSQQSQTLTTPRSKAPVLISGSLDNTIKVWDIETGKAVKTFFGHIEGVWGVAADKMRLVSASHDRTVKVWNREDGKCIATLIAHAGAFGVLVETEDAVPGQRVYFIQV